MLTRDVRPVGAGRGRSRIVLLSVTLAALAALAMPGSALARHVRWHDQYGYGDDDVANAAAVLGTDTYVAGQFDDNEDLPGIVDGYVRHYDALGSAIWTRRLDSTAPVEATSIEVSEDGIWVGGWTRGDLGDEAHHGARDGFIARLDFDGNILWTRVFGGPENEQVSGLTLQGGHIVAVGTLGPADDPFPTGSFIRRYTRGGSFVHQRTSGMYWTSVDAEGPLLAVGGYRELDGGSRRAVVRAYDAATSLQWHRDFDPGLAKTNGVAVVGERVYAGGEGSPGMWLRSWDAAGDLRWAREVGSAAADVLSGIAVTPSSVFIAGTRGVRSEGGPPPVCCETFYARYRPDGSFAWSRSLGYAAEEVALGLGASSSVGSIAGVVRSGTPLPGEVEAVGRDAMVIQFGIDESEPVVVPPQVEFGRDRAIGSNGPPLIASWEGDDRASGIGEWRLQMQLDGGDWSDVDLDKPDSTEALFRVKPGSTARLRVRATDTVGNKSQWVPGDPFRVRLFEETSTEAEFTGDWDSKEAEGASGGAVMTSSSEGAMAILTASGNALALATMVGPDQGKVRITVDGGPARIVDLYADDERSAVLVFARDGLGPGTHTMKIRVLGTPGRPEVAIDAWVTTKPVAP